MLAMVWSLCVPSMTLELRCQFSYCILHTHCAVAESKRR